MNYRIVLESKGGIHYATINKCEGIAHACQVCRRNFPFEEWRIINISEVFDTERVIDARE